MFGSRKVLGGKLFVSKHCGFSIWPEIAFFSGNIWVLFEFIFDVPELVIVKFWHCGLLGYVPDDRLAHYRTFSIACLHNLFK